MQNYSEFVRLDKAHLTFQELLREPTSSLLGVSTAAAAALSSVGIVTVFDLGASWLFANARAAASAASRAQPTARLGIAPTDWLQPGVIPPSLEDIQSLDIASLRGLTAIEADSLRSALDIATIRDFAMWPPHAFARGLLTGSLGTTGDVDEIQGELLRPRFGDHPTERVYYSTLVMLQMNESVAQGMADLSGAVSLRPALNVKSGFTRPAIGAMLTFGQSWYAQGTTLGHLLHSLALAPGEATRIAIVDWSRRTSASVSESVSEDERLDSAASHARAISEVQNAVADEMQRGGSTSDVHSQSESSSEQVAAGTGLFTSLFVSADASYASQSASTDTSASSSSWSLGNRSVTANMAQNINDRTEQHSTSVRNRRATAVREVSQSEHEQVSTRIVANYNHMHAVTVQYYEIVQVYRVATELRKVERVLFLPFELIDFSTADAYDWVDRFRGALLRSALSRRARELLIDDTTAVEVRPEGSTMFVGARRPDIMRAALAVPSRGASMSAFAAARIGDTETAPAPSEARAVSSIAAVMAASRVWDPGMIATASRFVGRPIVRPNSDSLFVPDDTEIVAVTFDGATIAKARLDRVDPGAADQDLTVINGRVDLPPGTRMAEVDSLHVARAEGSEGAGSITIHCAYLGRRFSLPAIPINVGTAIAKVVSFVSDQKDRRRELLAHLDANRAHYSHAVFRSLDSATLVMLLAGYTLNGRPLIDQVEPKPLGVAGNFIVLRAPVDYDEGSGAMDGNAEMSWRDLLIRRSVLTMDQGRMIMQQDSRVVPIPTNGVFAEAVLGRSNSAEKLDITRFWNWQDSPIPLLPPEIAPVGTGSRALPEDLKPGQLGQPVLNIVNPTSLPDPAGVGAVLNAVSNGAMFRDMSGLAGTQSLAGDALEGTLKAATQAGQIASANLATEAKKSVAMGQIAADLAKSIVGAAMGVPTKGGSSKSTGISGDGARINHGRDMDKRSGGGRGSNQGDGEAGGESLDESEPSESSGHAPSIWAGSHESGAFDESTHGFSPGAIGDLSAKLMPANFTSAPEDESGLDGSGGGGYQPATDQDLAESVDIAIGSSRNQLQGLDASLRGARGDALRLRFTEVAAEFEIDPEALAMNALAEEDDVRVWLSAGEVLNTVIGVDYWHEQRAAILAAMPGGSSPITSRELAVGYINEAENETGPRHAFSNGLQATRALAAMLRYIELQFKDEVTESVYNTLEPMTTHFVVRLWFNAGHVPGREAAAAVRAGNDPLIRRKARTMGPRRAASIRAAQAAHLKREFFTTTI